MRNIRRLLRFFTSHAKSSTISRVPCNFFFDEILNDFHDVSGMCLFPEENQQPILGSHRFPPKTKTETAWSNLPGGVLASQIDEDILSNNAQTVNFKPKRLVHDNP